MLSPDNPFNMRYKSIKKKDVSFGQFFSLGDTAAVYTSLSVLDSKGFVQCSGYYKKKLGTVVAFFEANRDLSAEDLGKYFSLFRGNPPNDDAKISAVVRTQSNRVAIKLEKGHYIVVPESWWNTNPEKRVHSPVSGYVDFIKNTEYYMEFILGDQCENNAPRMG